MFFWVTKDSSPIAFSSKARRGVLGLAVALSVSVICVQGSLVAQTGDWIVDPKPTVEIGASPEDPRDQLGLVGAVGRLSSGRIVILDGLMPGVRLYGEDGGHMRDIGASGDGPGEFREPIALTVVRDTVFVLDRVGRLTLLDSGGDVIRVNRLSIEERCDDGYNARFGGLVSDGSLLVRCEERLFGRVRGEYRRTVGLLRVRVAGEVDTLGWFPADTGRTDRSGVPVPRPYVPASSLLWAASDRYLFIAVADVPRVRVFSLEGDSVGSFDVPASRRAVTTEDVQDVTSNMLRIGGSENDRRVVGEWVSGMPRASRTPALRTLRASRDELWVETWDQSNGGSWWLVLGDDGRLKQRILAPPDTGLLAVGTDWILGLWRDAYGVERVRLHAVRRG